MDNAGHKRDFAHAYDGLKPLIFSITYVGFTPVL